MRPTLRGAVPFGIECYEAPRSHEAGEPCRSTALHSST